MKCKILVVFFLVCLLVTACGKDGEKNASGQPIPSGEPTSLEVSFVCDDFFRDGFMTEEYVLYHAKGSQVRLFDVASMTDIAFCFDPSCEHKQEKRSRTGELLEEGCVSYNYSSYPVMFLGENCYFLNQETGEVICSDRQGANRKVIGTIPQYILPRSVFFAKDTIFVTYANSYEMIETKGENGETQWIVGDPKPKNTCGIVAIDLETGEYRKLQEVEEYSAFINEYDVRGDHLYYQLCYMDIPYISPNLETEDPSLIPEGMTVENYWEELRKHGWVDVYDYTISTGELRTVLQHKQSETVVFCKDFFAMEEETTTGLYRYTGERFRELDFPMTNGVRSDSGLVCRKGDSFVQIDENTGDIVKTSPIPAGEFIPRTIIGNSCYGDIYEDEDENGRWTPGYLSANDFWDGNMANVVKFNVK